MRKQKGFTLIELLVVIAIIGLLSTLAVVSLNNARLKSRDARRVSDVKQIQTALELYYNDVNAYPATGAADSGDAIVNGSVTYMAVVPTAPTPPTGNAYTYAMTETGASYTLTYTLEGASGGIVAGAHTATPAGIANP
ncbi:MAG: prepilin-type N-terminal cleavage/methylation domain-containing protein [Patescibacteria group bacterium]|jgi:prepilin-type N-terminal cleavage/methylation domain-containing protein